MSPRMSAQYEQLLFDLHFLLRSYEGSAEEDVVQAIGVLRPAVDLVVHNGAPELAVEEYEKQASKRTRLRIVSNEGE